MPKPQIHYFPIRGRAEPIRLALSVKGIDFDVVLVDYADMKANVSDPETLREFGRLQASDGSFRCHACSPHALLPTASPHALPCSPSHRISTWSLNK